MSRNLDPTRINNYNKFLMTLDENSINKKPNNNIPKRTYDKEIDEIIDLINTNFIANDLSSSAFNGISPKDNVMSFIDPIDPNKYVDFLKPKPPPIKQENKEKIDIIMEISSIKDLLELTDKYPYDDNKIYNIDIKSLHDIKSPLIELNNMIGMDNLKANIVDQILYFIQRLHKNPDNSGEYLHTVIYGPPGTGKTEIAKIMGKIYSKIGILSNGTFKKVTRSDLIAGFLGQTALKTKDVIKEAIGGVLFIDEAYSLGNPEKRDSFSKECIDTICEAISDYKDDLMVIVAGYEKELRENFFSYNQGLDSRFTWRFKTDDYSSEHLYRVYLKKVADIGWRIDDKIDLKWFEKNKNVFPFFGRDIEALLSKTKIAHSRRVFCKPDEDKKIITLEDLNKGLEIYMKNNDSETKKKEEELKRYLFNTIYS